MLTAFFFCLACAMLSFVYLIDLLVFGSKAIAFPSMSGDYLQTAIFIIGLGYCVWVDWRASRRGRQH